MLISLFFHLRQNSNVLTVGGNINDLLRRLKIYEVI